jgi:dihydrofolate synthase/folylpolyglutamate synthase
VTTRLQRRLEELYGLERRKDKLGLDGTLALLRALGDPHHRFRSVHVAGTNGKGSVCAMVERVLREAGHRTGLYTSPHLVDFRERIRVDGRWVDEAWLERTLDRIEALPEGRDRTFFEVATALGFCWFAEQKVDIAVVEVGLGGRLDCTNVLTPEVSVITSIGLDHTEILGDTIEKIAAEKAGILKPGVPVVLAPRLDERARRVVSARATEVGAPIIDAATFERSAAHEEMVWVDATHSGWGALHLELDVLRGAYQVPNVACALAALDATAARGVAIPKRAVEDGLRAAHWPGRLEPAPFAPLWWDGAHNPQAMIALERSWHRSGLAPPGAVALAVSRDKDLGAMLAPLRRMAGECLIVATRSRNERALDPERIQAAAGEVGFRATRATDVPAACRAAVAETGPQGLALLTGSLFAVGEAMEAFGGAPGEWL